MRSYISLKTHFNDIDNHTNPMEILRLQQGVSQQERIVLIFWRDLVNEINWCPHFNNQLKAHTAKKYELGDQSKPPSLTSETVQQQPSNITLAV